MRIEAIVLAAGESRRMGRPKLTLPYGDSTIIETVIDALAQSPVEGITVVLGSHESDVRSAIERRNVTTILNPRPERGMLSSAQCALNQIRDDAEAFLFALGDQPQVQPETIAALIDAAQRSGRGILLPTFRGKRGHPLLIRARYRDEILALPDSVGLNALLQSHAADIEAIAVDSPSILMDIDTPDDYRTAVGELNKPPGE